MINLADLGLEPVVSASTENDATVLPHALDDNGLVIGSVLARAMYETWVGTPTVICDSPPGAGKTTLVIDLLHTLLRRSDLAIVVACPTRRGAADLAGRLATRLGLDAKTTISTEGIAVVLDVRGLASSVPGVRGSIGKATRVVTVKTVASCALRAPQCDVMIVDEAYQTKYSDVACAAEGADQVVMVGDPGQIGPVVRVKTGAWEGRRVGPHMRAPEVFALRPGAVVLRMDATYRLGQRTVDAIAPLYGFAFTSKRPDRLLVDPLVGPLPEIASIAVPVAPATDDVATLRIVALTARSMVGRTVQQVQADGTVTHDLIEDSDVAVVVAHNDQSSTLSAMLRAAGVGKVSVGTADKLQGGQWHAVVALDPLVGHANVGGHQVHPGRLCVMASRHQTHLTWVHERGWEEKMAALDEAPAGMTMADVARGIAVRRTLTSTISVDQDRLAPPHPRPVQPVAVAEPLTVSRLAPGPPTNARLTPAVVGAAA